MLVLSLGPLGPADVHTAIRSRLHIKWISLMELRTASGARKTHKDTDNFLATVGEEPG
jgi:hypothetical protein